MTTAIHLFFKYGSQSVRLGVLTDDVYAVLTCVGWSEKWEALDVVPVSVGAEKSEFDRLLAEFINEGGAESTDA